MIISCELNLKDTSGPSSHKDGVEPLQPDLKGNPV